MKTMLLWTTALTGIVLPGSAMAQDGGSQTEVSNDTPETDRMEIVVTARQRTESLQDVPIAVAALGGDFLALLWQIFWCRVRYAATAVRAWPIRWLGEAVNDGLSDRW